MFVFRVLLFPFSVLYGLIIFVRNYLYQTKIYGSVSYDFPIICVGNLSTGGTGKTPQVEYLIKLVQKNNYLPATLSRGYKRKSVGFVLADENSTADLIGDEPLQYFKKFKNIFVAVAENRILGIAELLATSPSIDAVILDDAFQHRAVNAGFNVLLTRYDTLFTEDYLLPMGLLREFRSGANRANAIVVSKIPTSITHENKEKIKASIKKYSSAPVFFSFIKYGDVFSFFNNEQINSNLETVLLTGIADHTLLLEQCKLNGKKVIPVSFSDHHRFEITDLEMMHRAVINEGKTWNDFNLITTEKDAMRLMSFKFWFDEKKINLFVMPIEVDFIDDSKTKFDDLILKYMHHAKQQ
ncbi:MAG: tetraacyldisaccharide 4-kinase [Bacteroidota bacterium]|jgi:tetraacyldisaccharide 4'-kinase